MAKFKKHLKLKEVHAVLSTNTGNQITQKMSVSPKNKEKKMWSGNVTATSNALDLESHIFESNDPVKIAKSLKHSAEVSKRRKAGPFQSAMSMLTFYINRAGKNLDETQKQTLEKAKDELRKAFGREPVHKA